MRMSTYISKKGDLIELVTFEIFDRDQTNQWVGQDVTKFLSFGQLVQHVERAVNRGVECRLIWEWKR